jgi:hypothetical protein
VALLESVFLLPAEGRFDPAPLEKYLSELPDVLLDPLGSGLYLVCGQEQATGPYRDRRLERPWEFPYVVLVTVTPEWVNVVQEYGNAEQLRSAREIVRWLLAEQPCRVEDAYQGDWTERVARDGVDVLYPDRLDEL